MTQFVELAVSKDESRYNLCSIYRDKTELVATDGHRLHLQRGLPELTPHFINGLDAQFPEWQQIYPKNDAVSIAVIRVNSAVVKQLKTFNNMLKTLTDKFCAIDLTFDNMAMSIKTRGNIVSHWTNICGSEISKGESFTITLNGNYFLDALSLAPKHGEFYTIEYRGEFSPLIIKRSLANEEAVIMPIKNN
jgi:DNA polymerase III sliding clamp (beta) subunit (PCNA family)